MDIILLIMQLLTVIDYAGEYMITIVYGSYQTMRNLLLSFKADRIQITLTSFHMLTIILI